MPQSMNLQQPNFIPQAASPNAVSINIFSPAAYGNGATTSNPIAQPNNFYSLYGANQMPGMYYPTNYNNMIQQGQTNGLYPPQNNAQNDLINKSINGNDANVNVSRNVNENTNTNSEATSDSKKAKNKKPIIPLTDDYIKSLENYMNDSNPKVRLIAAKDILERFKEDENRKDNPCLMALLNKALRDTSAAVRFLALTTLQLGYSVGNDETVQILKEIQTKNTDKVGEDQLLAAEILLKMSAGEAVQVEQGGK